MHCPQSFAQIERDLSFYPSVDPDRNAQEIPQRFGQRQSLCHYTVKDNKVIPPVGNQHRPIIGVLCRYVLPERKLGESALVDVCGPLSHPVRPS